MARKPRRPPEGADEPEDDGGQVPAGFGGTGSDRFDRLRRGTPQPAGSAGEAEAEDEHAWMTTYTDMVTLLLTCFIMLVSLATFTDRDSEPLAPPSAPPPATEPAEPPRVPDALFLRQPPDSWSARLSRELGRFVEARLVGHGMTVLHGETVITVRLNESLLFLSGRVEVGAEGRALLHQLAPLLEASPARIEVQGHTDSVPIATWLFPSNWELSAARAAAVLRILAEAGVPPVRLRATGLADTVPLAGNDTADGRQANRRVELVLQTPFNPPDASAIPASGTNR